MEVKVRSTNSHGAHVAAVADACRELRKEMVRSGVLGELRKREHYRPPSKARALKRSEARRKRKQAEKKDAYWNRARYS